MFPPESVHNNKSWRHSHPLQVVALLSAALPCSPVVTVLVLKAAYWRQSLVACLIMLSYLIYQMYVNIH